jgi:hypothetical protein
MYVKGEGNLPILFMQGRGQNSYKKSKQISTPSQLKTRLKILTVQSLPASLILVTAFSAQLGKIRWC